MGDLLIRKMEEKDLDEIMIIEQECFVTPWSRDSFVSELVNKLALYFVLVKDDKIIGYCGMWLVIDEAHITNIAIRKEYQGNGYGFSFLSAIIDKTADNEINHMTLEVRVTNTPAIKLYEKLGFISHGVRPKYYQDTNEDALIMWKEL